MSTDQDLTWILYAPRTPAPPKIRATSCCGEYELASEGGQYFVLRPAGDGHEETGRGTYAHAAALYTHLAEQHRCSFLRRGGSP
ncbi:hypothetical protein GCM10009734_92970 [Nonomuraea bangladeshensis]